MPKTGNPLQDKLATKISETNLASPDIDPTPNLAKVGLLKTPILASAPMLRNPSHTLPGISSDQDVHPNSALENYLLALPKFLPTSSN